MNLVDAREANGGTLPAHAWPGGYPIVYLTVEGLTVCPDCANEPDTSDPVRDGDVNWEGAPVPCDDCGKPMESAYGDPDAEGGVFGPGDLPIPDGQRLVLDTENTAAPLQYVPVED